MIRADCETRRTNDLTPVELILSLMHFSNGSIPGALYLQKLVFLAVFEDSKHKAELQKTIKYRPLNFGPYSDIVRRSLDEMCLDQLVVRKKQLTDKYNRDTYLLTEAGRTKGRAVVDTLEPESREFLQNLCIATRQLGYSGILRYVYSNYPEYASRSEIKEEVFKSYDY